MDCERFRELIAEDVRRHDDALERHAASCPPCRAYATRMRASEHLIERALRIDAARLRAPRAVEPRPRIVWTQLLAGVAAGIVGTLAVWALLAGRPDLADDVLAQAVAEHWYHEPAAWVQTEVRVAEPVLLAALDGRVELDLSLVGSVSYARSCFVGGRWIPHLVVQSVAGPVMVLLLPERRLDDAVPLSLPAEGLGGRLLPAGSGSIAVLGADGEAVRELESVLPAAVRWTG